MVFFRIWNMGGVNQPLGVPSLLSPSLSPFPSLPPFPLKPGVLCESWGVLTPLRVVWETPWQLQ